MFLNILIIMFNDSGVPSYINLNDTLPVLQTEPRYPIFLHFQIHFFSNSPQKDRSCIKTKKLVFFASKCKNYADRLFFIVIYWGMDFLAHMVKYKL